jgi:hypothetical protein
MVATATTFVVAVPGRIDTPTPLSDPSGYDQLRNSVGQSIGGDLAAVFAEAVRERANVRINHENYDNVVQP